MAKSKSSPEVVHIIYRSSSPIGIPTIIPRIESQRLWVSSSFLIFFALNPITFSVASSFSLSAKERRPKFYKTTNARDIAAIIRT